MQARMLPPQVKPHTSVVRLPEQWYVACTARELKRRPLQRTVLGIPMVLFRSASGAVGALLDRCSHRNVPLSDGAVAGPHLRCSYHGWEFDTAGACRSIPGLCGAAEGKGRKVPAYPVREQDGYVWVYATPDCEPATEPFRVPLLQAEGYTIVRRSVEVEGTLHATIENALDVPHTAFLHAGLFRGGKRNEIEAVVRRFRDRVEVEYVGEPRPTGLAARILAPRSDGAVVHYDRFILPSIAQVEYSFGDQSHLLVSALCTPVEDFRTVMHAVIAFRLPIPGWLVRPVLEPVALRIFGQDQVILRKQTAAARRFGGEQYVSTEIDLVGAHILRLMKASERGEVEASRGPGEPTVERRVRMLT